MIKPEDLQSLPKNFMATLRDLEDFIIKDVCRRVAKQGEITDTALHQIKRAAVNGADIKALERYIHKVTGAAIRDIDRQIREMIAGSVDIDNAVYRRAGYDPIDISRSPELSETVEAGIKQTKGELVNLTQSMGFRDMGGRFIPCKNIYQKVLDHAALLTISGGIDYITATRNATKVLTERGLETISYASGHINHADVAVRRAIVTGVNQMAAQMNEMIGKKLGAEFVEVTAHSGARPDHQIWQGKVYHLGGTKDGYPDFELATGYGSGEGLCGWNCRHSFHPFFPGISERLYTDEELANIDPPDITYNGRKYSHYQATQRQRQMESAIRKTKREILAAEAIGDRELALTKSIRLRSQKMAYADFSKAARLKLQMERTQNVGFGRSQARKVTARSEAHHKRWLKSIGAEDTKLYTLDKYYEGKYNNSPAYKVLMDYKDLVKHGEISPLLGLRAYSNYVKAIENNLIGIKTPLGFEVEGFTPHFVGRAIGRAGLSKKYNRDSVSVEDLLACLKSGRIGKTQISSKGEKSVLLISDKCFISMNPDKKILVQCNP